MSGVLLILIDGLGIGTRGQHNPLSSLPPEASRPLAVFADEDPQPLHDGVLVRTDACLGVEGRPQSAGGQTTILTGVNVPKLLGRHAQGFPNEQMRAVIGEHSVFLQLARAGVGPNTFANAYTPNFFAERPRRLSATTLAVEAAGLQFRTLEDLIEGRALFHDFTNRRIGERNCEAPPRTPAEAAEVLARLADRHRFTLYEYFITDLVGHSQNEPEALEVLSNLALFVRELLARVDLGRTTVILTSDHGNVEDLSRRNHTRNFVPTLAWGPGRVRVASRVRDLADVTPAIIEILTAEKAAHG